MLIGYARVSKNDGSQQLDLQTDALTAAGVDPGQIYIDQASGKTAARPGLEAAVKACRAGDVLVVWKLDRLGRDLRDLIAIVRGLEDREIGFKVLTGSGAAIDTSTAPGRMMFAFFGAIAEYERELIRERTIAGLEAARARGRKGGRPAAMTPAKLRLAAAAIGKPETVVSALAAEIGVSRATLYSYISPAGELRPRAEALLKSNRIR
jgi:DNA invertase Pin-like site-specific DNA recombinase